MSKLQKLIIVLVELILIYFFISSVFSFQAILLFLMIHLDFLVIRKANLIKNQLFPGAILVRRTVYFIPYIIGLFFLNNYLTIKNSSSIFWLIAFLAGLTLILPFLKKMVLYFDKNFLCLLPPITIKVFFVETYSLIGSAIFQELFFRGFIISVLLPVWGPILSILFSAVMFFLEHFLHYHGAKNYSSKDYLSQFLMGLIGGLLFVYTANILYPILVHLIFNISICLMYFARLIHKKT